MKVNQLKAGALLSYIVLGMNNLVGLLYTPYMLRMMGQSEYGLYSLGASVVACLTILDFGFGNAIVRYTSKFRALGKTAEQYSMFGTFIVVYLGIGILTLLIGLSLYQQADAMFGQTMTQEELSKARIIILIMIVNLSITFPLSIFGSIITAYENFIFPKAVQIARVILNTAVMIILLKLGYRAIGMVVLATFFNIITLLLNFWYCRYRIKIKIRFDKLQWGMMKEIMFYSFYIFLNIIMDRIYWSSGQFILAIFAGTSTVAVFAVAIQLEHMYMQFSTAISGVFLPKITAMVTREQSGKAISDLFIKAGRIQFIIMAYILTGFILFGKDFITLWAGLNYSDSYIIALLFFISLTIPLIQNLGIIILQARNEMKFRSMLYVSIAVCSLALQLPLAKYYGGIGCSIGISSMLILGHVLIMNIYYYKKQRINIPEFWKNIIKMSLTPFVIGLIGYNIMAHIHFDTVIKLGLGIILFTIVYAPAFWFFGMNQYERVLLGKPLQRILSRAA